MSMALTKTGDEPRTRRATASPRWPLSRATTISILSVLAFFAAWQIAPELGLINGRFTSQPSKVFVAFVEVLSGPDFYYHAWVSLQEFVAGFALALAVSVPLGALLGTSRYARLTLDPPLMALYIAPTLVLLPILTIWLGIEMASKVAVVFLGAIFPIIVNTMAGMREADDRLVKAARAFGASRFDVFVHVLVPGALPSILMGVRLAVGRAVLGVVVGELYVSHAGVGHMLEIYGTSMHVDRLLVYALVVSAFGYGLTSFVRWLETRVSTWRAQA